MTFNIFQELRNFDKSGHTAQWGSLSLESLITARLCNCWDFYKTVCYDQGTQSRHLNGLNIFYM